MAIIYITTEDGEVIQAEDETFLETETSSSVGGTSMMLMGVGG